MDAKKLSNGKLLDEFRHRWAKVPARRPPVPPRRGGPERKLLAADYFSRMLFGLLNPVLDSLRGRCAASRLPRVQEEVCSRPVSLGSFSEAQSVFDPELLQEVFLGLSQAVSTDWGDPRLAPLGGKLKLVNGTRLPAWPRMHWAWWLDEQHRAAKLHLKFSVLRQAASDALITAGNPCERKGLRQFVQPGETVVGDRYYGLEYGFLDERRRRGVSLVFRIRHRPRWEVVEELELTEADRAAGVGWQGLVRRGENWRGEPIRLVRVEVGGQPLLLATDLAMAAELVALTYRYR